LIILTKFDIVSLELKGIIKLSLIFNDAQISLKNLLNLQKPESDEIMREYI